MPRRSRKFISCLSRWWCTWLGIEMATCSSSVSILMAYRSILILFCTCSASIRLTLVWASRSRSNMALKPLYEFLLLLACQKAFLRSRCHWRL